MAIEYTNMIPCAVGLGKNVGNFLPNLGAYVFFLPGCVEKRKFVESWANLDFFDFARFDV